MAWWQLLLAHVEHHITSESWDLYAFVLMFLQLELAIRNTDLVHNTTTLGAGRTILDSLGSALHRLCLMGLAEGAATRTFKGGCSLLLPALELFRYTKHKQAVELQLQ
jgi:hypothetical protein